MNRSVEGGEAGNAGVSAASVQLRAGRPRSRKTLSALVALATLLAATAIRADFRVVGSDLLGLDFTKAFYEFSGRNGVKLALAFDGSRPGLGELKAGRADMALVVLPPEEGATLAAFQVLPFGYQRVVVIVPASCPLSRITLEQLAMVFGTGEATGSAAAVRWGDLGVSGEWSGALVAPLAPEVGTGVVVEYFRHVVLHGRALKPTVRRFATVAGLRAEFAGDSRVLAIAPSLPTGLTNARVLPIAVGARQPGVLPTAETVSAGSYPLRLPVQVVFRPDRGPALTRLFEFLFSDRAAGLLEQADVLPLTAAKRAEQLKAMQPK